jgi:hypothetical protein
MLCTVLMRSAIQKTSLLVQKDGCHDMVSFSMVLLANILTPFSLFSNIYLCQRSLGPEAIHFCSTVLVEPVLLRGVCVDLREQLLSFPALVSPPENPVAVQVDVTLDGHGRLHLHVGPQGEAVVWKHVVRGIRVCTAKRAATHPESGSQTDGPHPAAEIAVPAHPL